MRRIGLVALLTFLVVQVEASSPQPVVVQEGISGGPRVVLGVDPKTSQRHVQLAGQGMPVYPTVDLTCDGKRRTIPLTRSEGAGDRIVATYVVPQDISEGTLKAVECRLLIPGRGITLAHQQLRAAWADSLRGAETPKILLARVREVIDEDTIKVVVSGRMETIRYIGVNTAETHHPTQGAEPGGREATDVNRQLVARQEVRLELDVQERDRYGRLLAYVYVGDQMVNAELVRRGYVQVMTVPPNVRHQELFVKLQREAREQKRGLWADPSEATTPPATVAQADHQSPGGRPGVPPESAWTCPAPQPIKGNFTTSSGERCIYHPPGGQFYDRTKPERCYATEADARQDGCRRSRR